MSNLLYVVCLCLVSVLGVVRCEKADNHIPGEGDGKNSVDKDLFQEQHEALSAIESAPFVGITVESCEGFVESVNSYTNDTKTLLSELNACVAFEREFDIRNVPLYFRHPKLLSNAKLKIFFISALCLGIVFGFVFGILMCSICHGKLVKHLKQSTKETGAECNHDGKKPTHYGNHFVMKFDDTK